MMALDLSTDRPWWKEPMVWLIAGLPATAVIAGFTTYFIAAHEPDSLVRAEYRKEGFALVEKTTAADTLAAELGLFARMTADNGRLEVTLKGRLSTTPERVALTIIHPTRESRDIALVLARSGGGSAERRSNMSRRPESFGRARRACSRSAAAAAGSVCERSIASRMRSCACSIGSVEDSRRVRRISAILSLSSTARAARSAR